MSGKDAMDNAPMMLESEYAPERRPAASPSGMIPPRITMLRMYPGEDVVFIERDVFEECSRRRYLALSEMVKARFAGFQAS